MRKNLCRVSHIYTPLPITFHSLPQYIQNLSLSKSLGSHSCQTHIRACVCMQERTREYKSATRSGIHTFIFSQLALSTSPYQQIDSQVINVLQHWVELDGEISLPGLVRLAGPKSGLQKKKLENESAHTLAYKHRTDKTKERNHPPISSSEFVSQLKWSGLNRFSPLHPFPT